MEKLGDKLGYRVVPMVTPFKQNGDMNYDGAAELASFLIDTSYCDSIVVAGTTGEFNTLSTEERMELFRVVKEAVGDKVPLAAGTGAASTREAVHLTVEAEKLGYDAAMVVGPYYCKPAAAGMYEHFRTVAAATKLPIMLYNIPIFTGANIDVDVLARLYRDVPNIVAVKDEAGINPTQMTDYALATDEGFTVYNGDDIMILCGMVQGAAGVVTGCSQIFGDVVLDMIQKFEAGDVSGAREVQRFFHRFVMALFPNGRTNPIPLLKAAIELYGQPVGPARLPLDQATPQEREDMRRLLAEMGKISA